jgi:hypothetical protein
MADGLISGSNKLRNSFLGNSTALYSNLNFKPTLKRCGSFSNLCPRNPFGYSFVGHIDHFGIIGGVIDVGQCR